MCDADRPGHDSRKQMETGGGELAYQLADGLRASLKIVQFAQGNLDPETIRGWPHEDLVKLAKAVIALPVSTDTEKEWAIDAINYASVAAVLERARKRGVHAALKDVPRSAMGAPGDYEKNAEAIIASQQAPQEQDAAGKASGEQQNALQP